MPLIHLNKQYNTTLSLWLLTEETSFFDPISRQYNKEIKKETGKNIERKRQWLCARHLIHNFHNTSQNLVKTRAGQPFLPHENTYISISHSYEMVGVLTSDMPCGLDIEKRTDKLLRLRSKFVSKSENTEDLLKLHLIWCAKEAIYKAYGKKKLNFKEDLSVSTPDRVQSPSGTFTGSLKKDSLTINYLLSYEIWNTYLLVMAEETHRDTT